MNDTALSLIQAARHLNAAASILQAIARPDIPAPQEGDVEAFLKSGHVKLGGWTSPTDIHAAYVAWCSQEGLEAMHPKRLGRTLTAVGVASRRTTNGMRLRALTLIPAPSEASTTL